MVEDLPLAPEEESENFQNLAFILHLRFIRAAEHWKGNTDLTLAGLIVRALGEHLDGTANDGSPDAGPSSSSPYMCAFLCCHIPCCPKETIVRNPTLVTLVDDVNGSIPPGPTRDHILALIARQDQIYLQAIAGADKLALDAAISQFLALAAEIDDEIRAGQTILVNA